MLAITRRPAEAVLIGSFIRVVFLGVRGQMVQFGIEAPSGLHVRSERPCDPGDGPVSRGFEERPISRLRCRPGQGFWIGDSIFVRVSYVDGKDARLGIKAPDEIQILREELVGKAKKRAVPARSAAVPLLMASSGRPRAAVQGG